MLLLCSIPWSKGYRLYNSSHGTKIAKLSDGKFFLNGNNTRSKRTRIEFEEKSQTISVPIVWKSRTYVYWLKSRPQQAIEPITLDLHQPIEPIIDIDLRRSQRVRRPTLLDDYGYLHENEFNIDQVSERKPFSEAITYSKWDTWFAAMKDELKSM